MRNCSTRIRPLRLVPVILIAIALLATPLVWLGVRALLPEPEPVGPALDSGARIEIDELRSRIEALQEQLAALSAAVDGIGAGSGELQDPTETGGETVFTPENPGAIKDIYPQVVLINNRRALNRGLDVPSSGFFEGFLGRPREVLTDDCEPMENPKLAAMLQTRDIGPVKVRMLAPALESLDRVFAAIKDTDAELFSRINTAGALCVRRIRGTQSATSSHSYGLAIDLNIDGKLDTLGDGKTQLGLTIIADFFKAEGWIWGAGFSREDSMHFEVSRQTLERWRAEGRI
jgi:hypothetical protein